MSVFRTPGVSWTLGIEDTCVYPLDGHALDEHVLTGHDLNVASDLRVVADLGAEALRYGMSWPRVHIAQGRFDWRLIDEAVDEADSAGIEIVADLVHYGTPSWLIDSFADPAYPDAVAEFAGALAERYRGRIRSYTPLNEPITTASFAGLRGIWPPNLTGWRGWVDVVVPIAKGLVSATEAIRSADPGATIIHVEASTYVVASAPTLEPEAALLRDLGWLPTDLMLGRVGEDHPLLPWLLRHGADSADLRWLRQHPTVPDVIGVNFYPDLTPRRLVEADSGPVQVAFNGGTPVLESVLEEFRDRYGLPLALTETSIEGSDDERSAWLMDSAALVQSRAADLDIRGYTWWPLFDFVDWSWIAGGHNVEEFAVEVRAGDGTTSFEFAGFRGDPAQGKNTYLRRMGLIRLDEQADGSMVRTPTIAAAAFRDHALLPASVGGSI